DGAVAMRVHGDGRPRARAPCDGGVDDVAVAALAKPGPEGPGLVAGVVVDGDPAFVASTEGDEVDAVVVPVVERSASDVVVPAHHVCHAVDAVRAGILWRSDLNAPVAGGSQDVGALLSDRLPVPLEQVGDD